MVEYIGDELFRLIDPLGAMMGGTLVAPAGYVFLTDPTDGAYLTDEDGAYLLEAI